MPANIVSVSTSHHQRATNNARPDCDTERQPEASTRQQQQSNSPPISPQSFYNSSYGSTSGGSLVNNSNNNNTSNSSLNNTSISSSVPGGVVTTQNISTVIKPQANNRSLQFVKIQTPELSKKAVEQIKLAEETKISKSKIKEVEEQEWHNQLLDWKSRRKQHFGLSTGSNTNSLFQDDSQDSNAGRKVKTFAQMIEQRAKSGNRLGSFHLQRYIGQEDNDDSTNVPRLNDEERDSELESNQNNHNNSNNKQDNFSSQEHNSKSRSITADSDGEAHSSTSSGFNQLDSKSPSSPEINHRRDPDSLNNNKPMAFPPPKCDNNNTSIKSNGNSHIDEPDYNQHRHQNSMSFSGKASEPEQQLNSTFQHSLTINSNSSSPAPPLRSNQIMNQSSPIRPRNANLDLDVRNKEISERRRGDGQESDNSVFGDEEEEEEEDEEDEEEEEEQKQLQRIAFEAKLKAFERLTVPGSQAPPKPRPPTRTAPKPPPPQPPSAIQRRPHPLPEESISLEERQRMMHQQAPPLARTITENKPKSLDDRILPSNNRHNNDNSLQTTLNNLAAQSPMLASQQQQQQVQPPPQFQQPHFKPINPDSSHHQQQPLPPSPPPLPASNNKARQTNYNSSFDSAELAPSSLVKSDYSAKSIVKQSSPIIYNNNNNNNSIPIPTKLSPQKSSAPKQHEPLKSHQMQQQQLQKKQQLRDDKDGTVLSVSGKKRCSSCKEELGRGAAAFVVESLSLVYHTNCFRCSVCHVNLSNGFRGVDVRVHAGALHCQNCYSRDGLNFSRV